MSTPNKTNHNIRWFKSKDGNEFYKINYGLRKISRISDNKLNYPDFREAPSILKDCLKINKQEWHLVENEYFSTTHFEWHYNGGSYRTCGKRYGNDDWPDDLPEGEDGPLCFHRGEVWTAFFGGNYMPRVFLSRINNRGEKIEKWTHVKNIRNFQKMGVWAKGHSKVKNATL